MISLISTICDMLYRLTEDVTGKTESHYFSPGGRYLMFAKLNDTGVPVVFFAKYGAKTNMYPEVIEYTYPKVSIHTLQSQHVVNSRSMAINTPEVNIHTRMSDIHS
jgi:hypothetical protein